MSTDFKIAGSDIGYIRLSDGTQIVFRIVVMRVIEGLLKPTGPDFGIKHTPLFLTSSNPSLKEAVEGKTQPPPNAQSLRHLNIWELQEIVDAKVASETVEYKATDGRTYKITVEMLPTIVSRTLEYADDEGNPIYHLRWSTTISAGINH